MSGQFTIGFFNRDAERDFKKLDGSQRKLVLVALKKLKTRADEIGVPLHGELAGCKKIKWRKVGLRMVFRILEDGSLEIVEIVAIGKRDRSEVYETARERLSGKRVMVEYDGTLR